MSSPRRRLRRILLGSQCIAPASVFDPASARLAEDLEFEAAMLAGSIASLAVLGDPDLVLITLTELADLARRICRAANLPLIVDADHGYGNALNVWRTVEELETAGVAALTIEDTELPPSFASSKQRLISPEEAVGKLQAALVARRDPDLVVVARTAALSLTSLDDALARAALYDAAEVDAIFFTGVSDRAQLRAIAALGLRAPIILGGGGSLGDVADLAEFGVRIRLLGHAPALDALEATYHALCRQKGAPADPTLDREALLKKATRAAIVNARIRNFMT